MQKDALQRDLATPDEACARYHSLREGVDAPDLATVKDFFRFYIATSCGRIMIIPTADSINSIAEWFFDSFTCVTGTVINGKDKRSLQRKRFSLWTWRI
jgi:hypothetical protein